MTNISNVKGVSEEHKSINYNNYDIHYFCSGSSSNRPIVLIHPAYSDHSIFDPILKFLAHEYYVIKLDLIGHGLSMRGKSKDQIDSSPEHIRLILNEENILQAHIVGACTGALIAQDFVQKYPFMSTSLISVGGFDINHPSSEVKKVRKFSSSGVFSHTLFSMDVFRKKKADHACSSRSGRVHFFRSTA